MSFPVRLRLVVMKIKRMEKEERKIGKKVLFSLFGLEEKTGGKENNDEKNHSGPTNI